MKSALLEMAPRAARTEAERFARCSVLLTKQDKAIMKAYKSIAHGGRVIDLAKTFRQSGVTSQGLPRLAICRADAERVDLRFYPSLMRFSTWHGHQDAANRITDVPNYTPTNQGEAWAKLPYIPPYCRRKNMSQLYVLWEATWHGRPSGDPFLLEKMGDNMYRIVAAWDITPVEAAAIS